jgi:molecular chaperone GrpE
VNENNDSGLAARLDNVAAELETKTVAEQENAIAELEEARKKAAENWDLFLRTRADADNIRRRAVIDVENAHKYGIEKFARELLAVMDSLEQGLAISSTDQGLREGMVLTHKLLLDILEKFGVQVVDPLGEIFDPLRHEALTTQVNTEIQPNTVITVIQKGFSLHERLLRPARVIVSKMA